MILHYSKSLFVVSRASVKVLLVSILLCTFQTHVMGQEKRHSFNYMLMEDEIGETTYSQKSVFDNVSIDFVPSVYAGYANFTSDNTSPKCGIGFGIDFALQFLAKDYIGFIPENYYMEASLGYSARGSGACPLHYANFKLSPIGYKYEFSDFTIYGKLGAYVGYSFSSIETGRNTFDTNVDIGALCSIGIEYQDFGVGISYERGFTNVCKSSLKLNNNCAFVNLSYKLYNIK